MADKIIDLRIRLIFWVRYLIEFGFKVYQKVLAEEFGNFPGRILDLGCGIGNFSLLFPKADYIGVDIDPAVIAYAKRHCTSRPLRGFGIMSDTSEEPIRQIRQAHCKQAQGHHPRSPAACHPRGEPTFLVADAKELPFESGFFDAALVVGLLHHLEEKEVVLVVKEIGRVVKRVGKVLIIEDERPVFGKNPLVHLLYTLDVGGRFRNRPFYQKIFAKHFTIQKIYSLRSGLWRYNVFVLHRR